MSNKINNLELRSDEVQEILTRTPSSLIRYGSLSLFIMIITLFFISYIISYPDIITADATLTSNEPPQKEFAEKSGHLIEINVANDVNVLKGQLLFVLESGADYKDVLLLKDSLRKVDIKSDSLNFPLELMPPLFLGNDLELKYSNFKNAYLDYLMNLRLQPFQNSSNQQDNNLLELKVQYENIIEQRKTHLKEMNLKKKEIERFSKLYNKGVIAAQEYESYQSELIRSERQFNNYTSQISRIRNQIQNSLANKKGINIEMVTSQNVLRRKVNQAFLNLKYSIDEFEENYLIRSELTGTISYAKLWNTGMHVDSHDLLFTIFPKKPNSYVAIVDAPALNSGKIKKGQRVNLKLANYPDAEYGSLVGKVASISRSFDDEEMYLVTADFTKELITTYGKRINLEQEALGQAQIITDDLRLIERFLYQFREISSR